MIGFPARLFFVSLVMLAVCFGCRGDVDRPTGNVLDGRAPTRSFEVARPRALTDGIAARAGDDWMTELTAHFESLGAFAEYDLGASYSFSAAFLQADNNDEYLVAVSDDGANFVPLWVAPAQTSGGQQPRSSDEVRGSGRYVRVSPHHGDGRFSISEVQLFIDRPAAFPPSVPSRRGIEIGEAVRGAILAFAAALVIFLFATARALHRAFALAALIVVVVAAFRLTSLFSMAWPVGALEIALIRATTAGVAALAVWGSVFLVPRFRPAQSAMLGVLSMCAVAAVATFFNLGRPQFVDRSTGRLSFIHHYDMRVYFPVAKYFDELGFEGVYLASVAAYADDNAGATLGSLGATPLRDMDTLRMTRVDEVEWKIRAVQKRFSQERWREFKRDMRYFRQAMGVPDYLNSITDHGGNATPLWFTIARLLFFNTYASETTLLVGALLDPFLLLLMFLAIGRAYGVRTMLACMIIFGANDFYMFGSNWAGATLRHDWLAYLGMGICALKMDRWATGGAILALSAMIRAFPAFALVGAVMPIGWAVWDARGNERARALPAALYRRRDLVRLVVGTAVCALLAWLISSFVFSFGSWGDWLRKVTALEHDPSVNETNLRALIAGTGSDQQAILRARWPLYALLLVLSPLAVIAAARGRRPDQTAVLALLLVPVIFNPANYYLHFVCLMPLLSDELRARAEGEPFMRESVARNWLVWLGVCVAQYWTVLVRDDSLHFRYSTALYFAAMVYVLVNTLRQNAERASRPAAPAARPLPQASAEPPRH
jgi:hypothetical protein